MNDKPATTSKNQPEDDSLEVSEAESFPIIPTVKKAKQSGSPKFIAAHDLEAIINIMSKCDKMPPEKVVRKLNAMIDKGSLIIAPLFGTVKGK
jgi:hypothetical protein